MNKEYKVILENNNIEIENPKATDIYIATIGDKAKTKRNPPSIS